MTVSETWPIEIRAEAIAVVFRVLGPACYGALVGNGTSTTGLYVGYLVGAAIMLIGGIVEFFLGVNAADKPLEAITKPLLSTGETPGRRNRPGRRITSIRGPVADRAAWCSRGR